MVSTTIKPSLEFVETMITQSCNLSCAGCSNYSDLPFKGYVTWAEGKAQIKEWLTRVDIQDFGIMGGEPLLNPEVKDWIQGIRELMPTAQIRFTTNGLLLDRNWELVELLSELGNCVLKITVHQNNSRVESIIQKIFNQYSWKPINEYGIDRFVALNNFKFQVRRPNIFYKTYLGNYENMLPHNNLPNDAFNNCIQQYCPLLYKGKLYKCSTSGLLEDLLIKVGSPNFEQWKPYITQGLSTTCSDEELSAFINNYGKPHSMCAMCPSSIDTNSKLEHYKTVTIQKYKINKI